MNPIMLELPGPLSKPKLNLNVPQRDGFNIPLQPDLPRRGAILQSQRPVFALESPVEKGEIRSSLDRNVSSIAPSNIKRDIGERRSHLIDYSNCMSGPPIRIKFGTDVQDCQDELGCPAGTIGTCALTYVRAVAVVQAMIDFNLNDDFMVSSIGRKLKGVS